MNATISPWWLEDHMNKPAERKEGGKRERKGEWGAQSEGWNKTRSFNPSGVPVPRKM